MSRSVVPLKQTQVPIAVLNMSERTCNQPFVLLYMCNSLCCCC